MRDRGEEVGREAGEVSDALPDETLNLNRKVALMRAAFSFDARLEASTSAASPRKTGHGETDRRKAGGFGDACARGCGGVRGCL